MHVSERRCRLLAINIDVLKLLLLDYELVVLPIEVKKLVRCRQGDRAGLVFAHRYIWLLSCYLFQCGNHCNFLVLALGYCHLRGTVIAALIEFRSSSIQLWFAAAAFYVFIHLMMMLV